jgi:hypothetical protein
MEKVWSTQRNKVRWCEDGELSKHFEMFEDHKIWIDISFLCARAIQNMFSRCAGKVQ